MARRIINKACNDLVGGAGTDASVSIGTELPKQSSVLKLTCRDVSHGNRQAVEIKPVDSRQAPKGPIQTAQQLIRGNARSEEKERGSHFINIDGSLTVKPVETQQPLPQTAYKMRSFMSTLDLGPRGTARQPTKVNQNVAKQPPPQPIPRPDIPQVPTRPADARMFLPKGIDHSDQPYVLPKFMPSYREMMKPKPKPDPLVSIVERTPPSLQKWALEWNTEPKKTISVDELREDLIREAAEKPAKPPGREWVPSVDGSKIDEMRGDGNQHQHNVNQEKPSYPETIKQNHLNTLENMDPAWDNPHNSPSYETRMVAQEIRETEPQRKTVQPLVDWVPPKYGSLNSTVYSFQEAIKNGTPSKVRSKPENDAEANQSFLKPTESPVYFDTEEQKFHEWFKAKMSSAAQSALNSPLKAKTTDKHVQGQKTKNLAVSSKHGNVATPAMAGQNKHPQEEHSPENNTVQSDSLKDSNDMIPPEIRERHKPASTVPAMAYEAENSSSFYHWLKLRGHHMVKNEPRPSEVRKDKEKTNQKFQNTSQFPWSVSYTRRRRVSTPTCFPNRPASKAPREHQKIVSQDGNRPASPRDAVKHPIKKSVHRTHRNSVKSAGKKLYKAISKPTVKSAHKKRDVAGKAPAKRLANKMPQPESQGATSTEQLWLSERWRIDSEADHVNNLRKTDVFGNSSKAASLRINSPPVGALQMKYWESKYIKKPTQTPRPRLTRNQTNPSSVDRVAKSSPSWFSSNKTGNGRMMNAKVKGASDGAGGSARKSNFSSVDEYSSFPLKLSQNTKDEVMDFSEDFDIDEFLHKEEAVEKELLGQRRQESKAKGEGNTENEPTTGKVKGKEHIKFPLPPVINNAPSKVHAEANEVDFSLKQRVQQVLSEDEFVSALGEDPGLEDLEWSEFIGPKNSLEHDTDLTRLIGVQARQLSSMQNSCL